MPSTSPDSIAYPDRSWTSGIVAAFASLASSIQTAFSKRQGYNYVWISATSTVNKGNQTGMVAGSLGYEQSTGLTYYYNGAAWINQIIQIDHQNTAVAANAAVPTSSTSLGTMVFPAMPTATRVEMDVLLFASNSDASVTRGLALVFSASAGTLTQDAAGSQYISFGTKSNAVDNHAEILIPAATAVTVTLSGTSTNTVVSIAAGFFHGKRFTI